MEAPLPAPRVFRGSLGNEQLVVAAYLGVPEVFPGDLGPALQHESLLPLGLLPRPRLAPTALLLLVLRFRQSP